MTAKIRTIKDHIGTRPISIQVDGGINAETGALCAKAGANVFVVGSAAYRADSMGDTLAEIKSAAEKAYSH